MPLAWDGEAPGSARRLEANLRALLVTLAATASARTLAAVAMAQDWHRAAYAGVHVPVPYFVGEVRDSDSRFPELDGYEIAVGSALGVPSADVPAELQLFEIGVRAMLATLDAAIPVGMAPRTPTEVLAVLRAAAIGHGEWVRIHPFANGNGRTARLWANWIAMRYGLPPFLELKPRPAGAAYAAAAAASMRGDHQPMQSVVVTLLTSLARRTP